ncbi:hypothetical protein UPYG_G00007480 [Umbra pygmaea]|uniref:WASp n=1 Tax=Umbra pygmaea TaxID=75934 RepID=A0ABD0XHU5_UMBPY
MSRGSKSKGVQENCSSSLLNPQENEQLEDLLGRRCASLATTVAQLYMALPNSPTSWSLQHTGVACFVKDNPRRSYFIRLFDLKKGQMIWEQELYNQMDYHCPRPFFHTFAADDCQVGLNFTNDQEAENFLSVVDEKIKQRNQRNQQVSEKKQRTTPSSDRGGLPPLPGRRSSSPPSPCMATIDIQNPDIQASRYRSVTPVPAPASLTSNSKTKKDKKKDKKKGSKLSKADIGAPSGFKHVSHVGWDPNNLDPDLKKLLNCAGISEAELNDEGTSELIQKVIEDSGGMEAVKRAMNSDPGPPPCSAGSSPPGTRRLFLPSCPTSSKRASAPPYPLPGQQGPTPSQPTRGTLPPPPPAGGGEVGRGALLDQIRLGRKLKNVTDNPEPPPPAQTEPGGIVGALRMAMDKRSKVIHSSDEGEEEGGYDDDDDDEWDD